MRTGLQVLVKDMIDYRLAILNLSYGCVLNSILMNTFADSNERLRDGARGRHHVLQGLQRNLRNLKRRRLRTVHPPPRRHNPQVRSECQAPSDL